MRTLVALSCTLVVSSALASAPEKRDVCEHMATVRSTPEDDRDLWIGFCIDIFKRLERKVQAQDLPDMTKAKAMDRMKDGYRCALKAGDQSGLDACAGRLEAQMQALLGY